MSSDAERIIGLYQRHAGVFDRERGRTLFEKGWLDRWLALQPPNPAVLDIGCGMGEPIARYLIDRGARVTGIDGAPAMIALCRERFPDHAWITADMRTLDLGRRFDGMLAWDSFFHLTTDDQRRMFAVFARHALPGAALLFTSGPRAGEAIGSYQEEALYHAASMRTNTAPCSTRRISTSLPMSRRIRIAAAIRCGWRSDAAARPKREAHGLLAGGAVLISRPARA